MAKTKEEREAEERQRQQESIAFSGRGLRRSIQQSDVASSSQSHLPHIPENDDNDDDQSEGPDTAPGLQQSTDQQKSAYQPTLFKMSESGGSGRNQLPESMRLKGEENYISWKSAVENLAKANGIQRYIHPKIKIPEFVDEFDEKANTEKLTRWQQWEAGDSSMKMVIILNVKKLPARLIQSCKTAREMWTTLQTQYEGSGSVLNYNAIEAYINIKYENYNNLEEFVIAYKDNIERLENLEISPPDSWHSLRFIMALTEAFPMWAERQRSNSRRESTRLSLTALIEDVSDEARNKDNGAEGNGAHYNGKPDKKHSKKDSKKKDKATGKKEGKLCKNCKNPNAYHKPEDCFVTNRKLRREWEEKTGKKFVPYKDKDKDKNEKSTKKSKDNDSSDDENERSYAKKDTSYHCLMVNRSPLEQQGTLFDTGAENHVVYSIDNLNPGTYKPADLPSIDTANGLTRPLGHGKRTLVCATDTEGETQIVHLNKVQYLPNCGINIFGARKLLGRGELRIVDRNLVVNEEGLGLFRFDENMMIIEAPRTYAFPAVTQKKPSETSIRLWHRRFGHLGLDNVQKTSQLVKGMILKKDEALDQEDESLRLCDPCERGKAMRHVRKQIEPRDLKVFDEVHIDVVMITPQGIGKKKYATIFTEKATSVRWAYFHQAKNGAYDALIKYQKMIKTQFNKVIKKWRMDGGKEYSPTKLASLAEELGQIVELTTPYNPEQDDTSERSIGILCERTRTAMIDMVIPMFLWPLILEAMVLIVNRTATSSLKGKTPYEAFTDEFYPGQDNRPSVAHLRVLGCKTYVQIPKERRVTSEKVKERAEVGILVGYEGTHIFKVYIPTRKGTPESRVVRSSNVRFDEGGLITKPLPEEEADISISTGTRGETAENRGQEQDQGQNDSIRQPDSNISRNIENESDNETDSPDEADNEAESPDEDDIEPLPEVIQPGPQSRPRGRPKGSKNKVHIPDPEFNRETRRSTRQTNTAFYTAYSAGPETSVYNDPETIEQAKKRPDWPEWKKAIKKEYRSLSHKNTWRLENRSDLSETVKILPGKLVLKTKRDRDGRILKHKARWVVKGFRQEYGKDFDQTYAGVCKNVTWKLAIAIAALFDLEIEQMDVISAFLNSPADSETYVEVPPDWEINGEVLKDAPDWACKLLKALYGLKQAPRLWQKELAAALQNFGYKPCTSDQCVYVNNKTGIMVVTYVDDMLIIGKNKDKIRDLKKNLIKIFEMEDLGPAKYFLGVRITRDREKGTIGLCQDAYINKILIRYGMENCSSVDTPMAAGTIENMIPYEGRATNEEIEVYGSKIGSLMYLAVQTRPDIAYGVSVLSRFLSNPSPQHIKAADRILRYLQGTKLLGIEYKAGNGDKTDRTQLHGFCDADFAGDKSKRKSVSGNVYLFAGGVISHSSKRQQTVAQSTTEAEYYSLAKAVSEALWLRQIMGQMMYSGPDIKSVKLYGDNQGSLSLAENPEFHQRTKHIDVKHHFIREHIANNSVDLWYIASEGMTADGLTKPLTAVNHAKFVEQLKMKVIKVD